MASIDDAVNATRNAINNYSDISKWIPTSLGGVQDMTDKFFKNPKIFAEKILKEKPVSASITLPMQSLSSDGNATLSQTVTIPFYMENEFSVGTITNNWSELVNMDMANAFTDMLNVVSAFNGSAQVSLQSEAMSLQSWKGSKFSDFSVNCLFIATNRGINPTKIIQTLAGAALPTKLKGDNTAGAGIQGLKNLASDVLSKVKGTVEEYIQNDQAKQLVSDGVTNLDKCIQDVGMVAPLHYGIDTSDPNRPFKPATGTTVTLQVGEYFRATELVVTSISNISFSKEVIAPKTYNSAADRRTSDLYNPTSENSGWGFPLYGKCTVGLRPCSMMTKEKFESYFINLHDQGGNALDDVKSSLLKAAGLTLP